MTRLNQITLLVVLTAFVLCFVIVVHWPALSAQAVSFDDEQYILKNPLAQNPGWASAHRFLAEITEPTTVSGYYQPLTMISLMLDYAMGGRSDNLMPFHLTSLCLHGANTALLIMLLYMLFDSIWPAAMIGLLFGVHPMTVESIPWLAERKTLLASFFALWCIIIYIRYTRKSNWKPYGGCMLLYVLALMAKPTTTPLPVLLLLLDFWPLRRLNKRALVEKLPLFVIMLIFAFITVISQGRAGARVEMPGEYGLMRIPLILCHNIIFYLYKVICPVNLSSHYPFPSPLVVSDPMILAGVVGTCILIPSLLISLRWTRALLTGWVFFFVAIFPTMGVIGFTIVIASDKYAYLPSVGLLMVLTWCLGLLWNRVSGSLVRRVIIAFFVLALAISESIATRHYLVYWQTTKGLYEHMLSLAPDAPILHNNYGVTLYKKGKLDESLIHFKKALRVYPKYSSARRNMADVLSKQGKLDEALNHYHQVLQNNPDSVDTLNNLAWLLATHRDTEFHNPREAIRLAERACELTDYKQPEVLDTLATAYAAAGRFAQAIETAKKAVKIAASIGKKELAQEIQKHIELYKAGQPHIESSPEKPSD